MSFADLRPNLFVIWGLKVPQVRKYILVLLKNLAYKAIKNVYIKKNRVKRRLLGLFRDKVVQCFVDICGFTICSLVIKYSDLRFADWHT